MKRILLTATLTLIILFLLVSCDNKEAEIDIDIDININLNTNISGDINCELFIDEIRVKSVVLKWATQTDEIIEYAIAVTGIGMEYTDSYIDALSDKYIVSDFEDIKPDNMFEVTGLALGKTYRFLLFGREKNGNTYLLDIEEVTFRNISAAGFISVKANSTILTAIFPDNKYTATYIYDTENKDCTFSYRPYRGCNVLYNGILYDKGEITIALGESVTLTVINEEADVARDFIFAYEPMDNGLPVVFIDIEDGKSVTDKVNYLNAVMKIVDSKKNPIGWDGYTSEFEMQIKGRGNSSFGMPKKSYTIELEHDTAILGMESSEDWMLGANYADKSLMRNYIAYELYSDMGAAFSPEMKFVDLVLNGIYVGTYTFGERIKVGKGRLDFPKMKLNNTGGDALTGTFVLEVNSADKYGPTEVVFETTRINWKSEHFYSIKQPAKKNLSEQSVEYITEYVNEAENALFSSDFKDTEKGFRAYFDEDSIIDWYIVNELFKNVDSTFHTSVYFYKPRGDKLYMGPVWDFDIGAGNIDYEGCENPEGWHVRKSKYMSRFFEDELFVQKFRERWNFVKEHCLPNMFSNITNTSALLKQSAELNFNVWRILGRYTWPNAPGYINRNTYDSEVDYLIIWLEQRIAWMDKEINK